MRQPLLIAVAQPRCAPYELAANAGAHAAAVKSSAARVVVFPELSLTGYELDAAVVDPDDPKLAALVEVCGAAGTVALAGAPVAGEDGQVHLGVLAISGEGVSVAYRKIWLGDQEKARFSPGPEPAVIEVDGWRLGLAICKDIGVPQHAEQTAALGIDAYLAGVLEHAVDAKLIDDRARRIATEHGVWVAVASFAGSTGGGYTQAAGRSAIWSAAGVTVARAGSGIGSLVRASLS